jgi:hypothetical protein
MPRKKTEEPNEATRSDTDEEETHLSKIFPLVLLKSCLENPTSHPPPGNKPNPMLSKKKKDL